MGVFYEASAKPAVKDAVTQALKTAIQSDPPSAGTDVDKQASDSAAAALDTTTPALQTSRLLIAVLIIFALIGAGIGSEAAGLGDSEKALYGFATTLFGVVAGLLGGEKSGS